MEEMRKKRADIKLSTARIFDNRSSFSLEQNRLQTEGLFRFDRAMVISRLYIKYDANVCLFYILFKRYIYFFLKTCYLNIIKKYNMYVK